MCQEHAGTCSSISVAPGGTYSWYLATGRPVPGSVSPTQSSGETSSSGAGLGARVGGLERPAHNHIRHWQNHILDLYWECSQSLDAGTGTSRLVLPFRLSTALAIAAV